MANGPERASPARRAGLNARSAYLLLFLFTAVYTAGYTWTSWRLHDTFVTSADDLSNVDQVVWNSQHGRILERTTGTRSLPRYGEHVEPIWIALGLIYFAWDDVRALLLAQSVALAAGAVPVFWLARAAWGRHRPDYAAGLVFAALYLLNPFVSRANIAEVHATPFAVAPMLLAITWGWEGKWKRVAPLALLVLLVREDTGLLVAAFGAWTLRCRLEREGADGRPCVRPGLALAAAGVAAVAIMTFGIIGTFADERFSGQSDSIFFERYSAFGETPLEIVAGMLTRPDVWAALLSEPYRLNFLRDFALSSGGLLLFAPSAWLLFAPHFGLNLLSDYFGQYGGLQHYGAPLVPGMMTAAVLGGARLLRWGGYRPLLRLGLLAAALTGAAVTARNATGQPLAADWITPAENDHNRLLPAITEMIPPGAPLSADPQLHPHVAHRRDAYRFPTAGDNSEWILVDVTTNNTRHPADLKRDVEERLAEGWGVAHGQDGYLLLQRGNPASGIPPGFFSFTTGGAAEVRVGARLDESLEVLGYTLEQDFWGRVAVEWYLKALGPLPTDLEIDTALLGPDGAPIPETVDQPVPALLWRPPPEWRAGEVMRVRTLPREAAPRFYPALAARRGERPLRAGASPQTGSESRPDVIPRQVNGWLSGGEWRLEHHHAVRGSEAWRRYGTPPGLKAQGATWEAAELRAWEAERENGSMTVTLTWRATGRATGPVQRFVHLVPREGAPVPVAQSDGVLGGDHPATEWAPGEWVTERLSLGPPPEGFDGRLLVGLYDPASGTRYPVSPDAGDQTFELRP